MQYVQLIIKKHFPGILILLFIAVVFIGALNIEEVPEATVVINEVCTSNVSNVKDDNGGYPDWIELYNTTDSSIDLSGYIIRKGARSVKNEFIVSPGIILNPGDYYVCDPGFALPSEGCVITLLDNDEQYVDMVDIPKLKFDTSYARATDGAPYWEIKESTCGWENSDGESLYRIIDGEVYASVESGFYSEEFDLKLKSSNFGRSIYYTTDGSDPVKNGILYDGSIRIYDRTPEDNLYSVIPDVSLEYVNNEVSLPSYPVDKCTVIKAVAMDLLGRYTDISTYVYFVGYDQKNAYDNMTVVSITTDPQNLFSYENGIMVLGEKYDKYVLDGMPEEYDDFKANFCNRGRGTEVETSVVVFDENHNKVLDTTAGMRLKGLSSRWDVQKSFAITFHKAVGGNYKETLSIDGDNLNTHSLALDKCGQDTDTKMIDTIMEYCMSASNCVTVKRFPCCVFLNGEYWGFYWLSERVDRSFLSDKYGVNIESVEIYNTEEFANYDEWPPELFDGNSLVEYYAANIIAAHEGDWPHLNFRIWRSFDEDGSIYGDGKYRPVIIDMNSESMKKPDFDSFEYMLYGSTGPEFAPFINLYEDENFRHELKLKVDKMESGEFEKQKVLDLIDDLYGRIHDQMILDKMRYFDCTEAEAENSFEESVDKLRMFYETRYDYLDSFEQEYLTE